MKNLLLLTLLCAFASPLFAQQNVVGSFEHDGETREYRLHIPLNYEEGMSLPLVISMHGYGSNATEQEFRQQCLQAVTNHKALDFMFDTVKEIALAEHGEHHD